MKGVLNLGHFEVGILYVVVSTWIQVNKIVKTSYSCKIQPPTKFSILIENLLHWTQTNTLYFFLTNTNQYHNDNVIGRKTYLPVYKRTNLKETWSLFSWL